MKQNKKTLLAALCALASFVLWTALLRLVDVREIGPLGSSVGLATLNQFFHMLTGVHMSLYLITDWLGLVPIFFAMGFAIQGLIVWIKCKNLAKVDRSLLILGGFYVAVISLYLFFERAVVNYRPILINGYLEPSYPSSTTLLVLCVMPTALMQLRPRIQHRLAKRIVTVSLLSFTAFTVIGRLISGVHWLTDIIGGTLLSTGLVLLYRFFTEIGKGHHGTIN